jgi:hypothetical protein
VRCLQLFENRPQDVIRSLHHDIRLEPDRPEADTQQLAIPMIVIPLRVWLKMLGAVKFNDKHFF